MSPLLLGPLLGSLVAVANAPAPSVAVFALQAAGGVSAPAAESFSEVLVDELKRVDVFSHIVSPREIARFISPEQRESLRTCALDECALVDMDVAGGLGVSHVLVGSIAVVGSSFVIVVKLIELKTGLAVADVLQRVRTRSEEQLLDAAAPVAVELTREAGFTRAGAEAGAGPSPLPILAGSFAAAGAGSIVALVLGGAAGLWLAGVLNVPQLVHALSPLSPRTQPAHTAFFVGPSALLALGGGLALVVALAVLGGGALASAALLVGERP